MTATDNFIPSPNTRTISVSIIVNRDSPTRFTGQGPLRLFISERDAVNSTITNVNKITATDSDLTVGLNTCIVIVKDYFCFVKINLKMHDCQTVECFRLNMFILQIQKYFQQRILN